MPGASPERLLPPFGALLGVGMMCAGCITDAQVDAKPLLDAWGDCVASAVLRMDDGKTDPVSIAYAIAPQCAALYQRFSEAEVGNYITENAQRAQRQLWREKEVQMISSAVLIFRSKKRT